jgi:hypothetical protein
MRIARISYNLWTQRRPRGVRSGGRVEKGTLQDEPNTTHATSGERTRDAEPVATVEAREKKSARTNPFLHIIFTNPKQACMRRRYESR